MKILTRLKLIDYLATMDFILKNISCIIQKKVIE